MKLELYPLGYDFEVVDVNSGAAIPYTMNDDGTIEVDDCFATVASIRRCQERPRRAHPNGQPMFAPDGMMLDEHGNRSIFDDVDD